MKINNVKNPPTLKFAKRVLAKIVNTFTSDKNLTTRERKNSDGSSIFKRRGLFSIRHGILNKDNSKKIDGNHTRF